MKRYRLSALVFLCLIFALGIAVALNFSTITQAYQEELPTEATWLEKVQAVIDTTEEGINSILTENKAFIELNGGFQRLIGRRVIDDADDHYTMVKLDNGALTFTYPEANQQSQEVLAQSAENTILFNQFLSEQGIPLLYIQAPAKIDPYDKQLPLGVSDYTNENGEAYLQALAENGIPVLNLTEEIRAGGLDHYSLFFKTDHHWTPEGAFWSFGRICELLNQDFGFQIAKEYYDLANYQSQAYPQYFLGSQGKRIGQIYSGLDDINLISPKFETQLTFSLPYHGITKSGTFLETVIDKSHIETKDLYNKNPYAMYTGGDFPINIITNDKQSEKKILMVRDSFGCAIVPFLSLVCQELDVIDLRYYTDQSLMSYVETTQPDLVIIMYNPSAYHKDLYEMFEFDH